MDEVAALARTAPASPQMPREESSTSTNPGDGALGRLRIVLRRGSALYGALYATRWLVARLLDGIDRRLVSIEQRRRIVEPWTISARRFTAGDNKRLWNEHDWSRLGEEWTKDASWKSRVVSELLVPHVREGSTVLEIGPGGGRWTEFLIRRAKRLIVLDVAERALDLCRERFPDSNLELLLGDGRTIALPEASVDAIWSYDVFVHVNPLDARSYFAEFNRILKPGGRAVIHHPGPPVPRVTRRPGWRSDLTDDLVRTFIEGKRADRHRTNDRVRQHG